jgi:hypothetical protein
MGITTGRFVHTINLGKFIHTERGRILMSILLGFGLASLFRAVCKGDSCIEFRAAPMDNIKDKVYKSGRRCVKYNAIPTKCNSNTKVVPF